MSMRSYRPLVLGFSLAGVIFTGGFLALEHCHPLREWLSTPATVGMTIHPDRIEAFTDRLRANYRRRWRARTAELDELGDRLAALRAQRLQDLRAIAGEDYVTELVALCREHHAPVTDRDLGAEDLTLVDMYDAARDAEQILMNHYHDLLAADIARRRQALNPIDVVGLVRSVAPRRVDLDAAALLATIRTKNDGRLGSFRTQIKRGISELATMVKHGQYILTKARERQNVDPVLGYSLISKLAADSVAGPTLLPDEVELDAGGTREGGFRPQPGRVLGATPAGLFKRNLYLDRWWMIGPFDNSFNRNLESSFSPETAVDLDEVIQGKDGRELHWHYRRSTRPRIEPDHAERGVVYYGWTEIWVEEAGDYYVAVGSDDFGKLWINGELLWESSLRPKPYRADEFMAAMPFRQGRNEILFRCTNHGGTMGWSVIFVGLQEEQ